MINSTLSGNNIYYYIKTSAPSGLSDRKTSAKILSSPKKSDSAETFLKKVHDCIKETNVIKLPGKMTLNRVVDQVLSGYQSKLDNLGILSRSWLCFLKVITYPFGFFGIHLTQLQKIRYYAKTIKALGESQSSLLSTDPDFALKRKLIAALPENSPERGKILKYTKYTLEQCLQAKTDSNPEMIFDVCQAYLKRGEAAKAKELLLSIVETGNSGREGDLFTEVISTCIEKEIPAIDLIEKMLALPRSSISDKNMDIIASSCEKAGKLHQFVADIDALPIDKIQKTMLYDGFVKECLRKIDLNETELRSKECRQLLSSSLLDKMSSTHAQMTAKMFFIREEYLFAIKAANLIYNEEEGKALLIEISNICTKNGHFEMALKSLEKIEHLKDEELPIAEAFNELIVASMEKNIDFANDVLQKFWCSIVALGIKIKVRASAGLLFERAMKLKNYRIACETLKITGDVQDDLFVERLKQFLAACPKDFNNLVPFEHEFAVLLAMDHQKHLEHLFNRFVRSRNYKSAIAAVSLSEDLPFKFQCLMQIANKCMELGKYDLVYESLKRVPHDFQVSDELVKTNEHLFNKAITLLISASLQKKLFLLADKAMPLVRCMDRMNEGYIVAVNILFHYAMEKKEYLIAIRAATLHLITVPGQDLSSLIRLSISRLMEISSLIDSDENLKIFTARWITDGKKLLEPVSNNENPLNLTIV